MKHTLVGNYGPPWVVLENIRSKEGGPNFLRSVIMTPRNTAWAPYYNSKMEYINIQKTRNKGRKWELMGGGLKSASDNHSSLCVAV